VFCYRLGESKGRSSFLKKRTKKILIVWELRVAMAALNATAQIKRSFLVLFFKKEPLPILPLPHAHIKAAMPE
jgi:hypothetical protein